MNSVVLQSSKSTRGLKFLNQSPVNLGVIPSFIVVKFLWNFTSNIVNTEDIDEKRE